MLFFYDTSRQCLMYPGIPHGRPTPFPRRGLELIGWKNVDEASLRLLPRFDAPTIQAASQDTLRQIGAVGDAKTVLQKIDAVSRKR